jgi:RHS repeat-associated protein
VDYDAYGNPISANGGAVVAGGLSTLVGSDTDSATKFGFGGGYLDASALIYLINRYYDSATGQFISVDPELSSTGTPYAYAGDNPIMTVDVLGLRGLYCMSGYYSKGRWFAKRRTDYWSGNLYGPPTGPCRTGGYVTPVSTCYTPGSVGPWAFQYPQCIDWIITGNPATPIDHGFGMISNGITTFSAIASIFDAAGLAAALARTSSSAVAERLALEVASKTGGTLKVFGKGASITVRDGRQNIVIRVMKIGGSRTNYYRIGVGNKFVTDLNGDASQFAAENHIAIGPNSLNDILRIVNKLKGSK